MLFHWLLLIGHLQGSCNDEPASLKLFHFSTVSAIFPQTNIFWQSKKSTKTLPNSLYKNRGDRIVAPEVIGRQSWGN